MIIMVYKYLYRKNTKGKWNSEMWKKKWRRNCCIAKKSETQFTVYLRDKENVKKERQQE